MKFKLSFGLCLATLAMSFVTAQAQIPCGPTITPLPTLSVNWPQYRFDAARSGCNPYESILNTNTVGNLTLKWTFPANLPIYASPVVANGTAYVASYGDLFSVDVNTGEFLWGFWPYGSIDASPVVANGVVYVGSDGSPYNLFALNARTGDVLWQAKTSSPVSKDGAIALANGVLYIAADNGVEARDANTGALLWQQSLLTSSGLAVADGMVYVSTESYSVCGLDAGTGKVLWTYYTGYNWYPSTPAAVNNVVYAGTGESHLLALNAKTGKLIWKAATDGAVNFPPAVANGVLYVATGTGISSGYLEALTASTGALIWEYGIGDQTRAPVVANGVVYGGAPNDFWAFDAATGQFLWGYPTGGAVYSSPAVANGVLYGTSADSNLYAFGLPGH